MSLTRVRIIRLGILVLLLSWLPTSDAQTNAERDRQEMESYRLLQLLKTAPPPPLPEQHDFSAAESASAEHRSLAAYDLSTGEVTITAPSAGPDEKGVLFAPPQPPITPWDSDHSTFVGPQGEAPLDGIDGEVGAAACTGPSPNVFTHTFPWTTTYKLLMRFNSGGSDFFYVCSAASMGSFHLLTAGHCIYNHDPNNDGNTGDAAWALEVWAWAAQTDLVNPFRGDPHDEDRPYGFARATLLRSYVGWTSGADFNHDMGYITLDRRDGDHTGWMGREAGITTTGLNFNGYPTETSFGGNPTGIPSGEIRQYPGFDAGNVNSYSTFRINMCAFVYGGHSGGPDWRYDGVDRFIQGVNSTSDRSGTAEATRLTIGKFDDITNIIAQDESSTAPTARPDLAEYQFTTADDRKDLLTNSVAQGDSFGVEYSVLNAGFAASGTVTVDFYLSTNNVISDLDTLVGTRTLGGLNAWTFTNPTTTLTANVDPGTYYLGWIMRSAVVEYGGDLTCTNDPCTNVAIIGDETLTVTPSCAADGWEPDDSAAQANLIFSGVSQTHSICPVGDEDWVSFTLGTSAAGWHIELETSGSDSDDTRMWLYDGSLSQVEFDDDDGAGRYSLIDRLCGVDALPPGTYYVQVDEFADNEEIESYQLALTASPCSSPTHILSVVRAGTGSGTVTSNPAGITCGGDCSQAYPVNTVVQLTATPAGATTFVGWSGDPDCVDGTVIMNAAKTCTATFEHTSLIFTDGFESGNTSAWSTSVGG